jgi:CHAD domain-containing protein
MDPVAELAQFAFQQTDRMQEALRQVEGTGDAAAIHGFRVASRRIHEALEVMRPWLPKADTARAVRIARRLRRALRAVRDWDVLLAGLSRPRTAPQLSAEHRAMLEEVLTAARQRAQERALVKLRVRRAASGIAYLRRLVERFVRRAPAAQAVVTRAGKTWRQRAKRLLAVSPVTHPDADLHTGRLRGKGLRYTTEILERLEVRPVAQLPEALIELQDALGAWTDHLFAARVLSDLACTSGELTRDAAWSAAVLRYAATRAELADEDRRAAVARWEPLTALLTSAEAAPQRIKPSSAPPEGPAD